MVWKEVDVGTRKGGRGKEREAMRGHGDAESQDEVLGTIKTQHSNFVNRPSQNPKPPKARLLPETETGGIHPAIATDAH